MMLYVRLARCVLTDAAFLVDGFSDVFDNALAIDAAGHGEFIASRAFVIKGVIEPIIAFGDFAPDCPSCHCFFAMSSNMKTLTFTVTKVVEKSYVTRRRRVVGKLLRQKQKAGSTINDLYPAQESVKKIKALLRDDHGLTEIELQVTGALPLKLRDEITLSFES